MHSNQATSIRLWELRISPLPSTYTLKVAPSELSCPSGPPAGAFFLASGTKKPVEMATWERQGRDESEGLSFVKVMGMVPLPAGGISVERYAPSAQQARNLLATAFRVGQGALEP